MKIGKYTVSKDIQQLASNIIFSGFGQLITLASPLFITPYLIRILGIEKFGIVALAQSVMMYMSYLVDYSFNIDATQEASIFRNDASKLTNLFSDVLWAKLFLTSIGLLVLLVLINLVPTFKAYSTLFLLSYTIVIGKVLLPQWLLIGTEHIREFTVIIAISKFLVYISIFFLIKSSSSYVYVNLLWGSGEILLSPFIYFFLVGKLGIKRLNKPLIKQIKAKLVAGWSLFVSNSVNSLYIYSNLTILSFFATPHVLGSYAVAEKIMLLLKQISGTIYQVTYPYACELSIKSMEKLRLFLLREAYVFVIVFGLIGALTAFFADYVILFFAGQNDALAVTLLRGFSFVPLLVSLNMSASQIMLINGIRKQYLQVVMLAGLLNVIANLTLVPYFLARGTMIAVLLTELFSTIGLHIILSKYHPTLQIFNLSRLHRTVP